MTHPDPRVAAIRDRNAQAVADAIQACPPGIADDPAAYLAWRETRPPATPVINQPRTVVDRPAPRGKFRRRPGPTASLDPVEQEAERNRQLDALQARINQEPTP